MAGATPNIFSQNNGGFNRPSSYGEDLEKKAEIRQNSDTTQQQIKVDTNTAWNNFLKVPEPSTNQGVSFTRLDTDSSTVEEKPALTFAEIFGRMASEETESAQTEEAGKGIGGSIVFEQKKELEKEVEAKDSEDTTERFMPAEKALESVSLKKNMLGTAEKTADITSKVAKRGFREGGEVIKALKDLWTGFIYMKEKKPDPKAKENAEKQAKRRANKAKFIGMLREGTALYYAAMRKALIELEVKLGTNVLRTEDKNRLLGRNRNVSFEGNDSIYAITQTAYAMVEQKKRQQAAQSPARAPRGKASRGQIFTDKNLSGERSGGNNMMSAVG